MQSPKQSQLSPRQQQWRDEQEQFEAPPVGRGQ